MTIKKFAQKYSGYTEGWEAHVTREDIDSIGNRQLRLLLQQWWRGHIAENKIYNILEKNGYISG